MCSPCRRSTGGGTSREALVVSAGASADVRAARDLHANPRSSISLASLILGGFEHIGHDRWQCVGKRPSRACRPAELQRSLEASEADDEDTLVRPDAAVPAIAPSASRGSCDVDCCAERAVSTDDASGRRRPDHRAAASGASACEDGGLLRDQRSARRPSWVAPELLRLFPRQRRARHAENRFYPRRRQEQVVSDLDIDRPTRVTLHRPPVAAVEIPWSDAVACRGRGAVLAAVPRPVLRRSRRCR